MNSLRVSELKVWDVRTGRILIPGNSFRVRQGSCLAIVGESGSGKSLACRALMRLNGTGLRQSGDIQLGDNRLSELSDKEMRLLRGKRLGMIVQNGMRAFDPSCVIGVHLRETLKRHFGWNRDQVTAAMKRAMETVLLKDPVAIMNSYPHQLSGGMLQRVMIALTLVLEPDVVIADEPTTALDTVSQHEVIEQLVSMRERIGCSLIFVTHDLGIVRRIADEVLVMNGGAIVESGAAREVLSAPRHDYTRYLVNAKQPLKRHFDRLMGGNDHAQR